MRWLSATGTKRVPSFGDDVHLARDVAGEGVELRLRGVDVPEGEPEGLETWRMGDGERRSRRAGHCCRAADAALPVVVSCLIPRGRVVFAAEGAGRGCAWRGRNAGLGDEGMRRTGGCSPLSALLLAVGRRVFPQHPIPGTGHELHDLPVPDPMERSIRALGHFARAFCGAHERIVGLLYPSLLRLHDGSLLASSSGLSPA